MMINVEDAIVALQDLWNDAACPPFIQTIAEQILYGLEDAAPPNYTIMKYRKTGEKVRVYQLNFDKMEAIVFDEAESCKSGNGWKRIIPSLTSASRLATLVSTSRLMVSSLLSIVITTIFAARPPMDSLTVAI